MRRDEERDAVRDAEVEARAIGADVPLKAHDDDKTSPMESGVGAQLHDSTPQPPLHPHIAVHGMEGVPNFRDIASASPHRVRPGVLFRSGTPSAAT